MGHRMKGQKRLGSGLGDACKGLVEEGWEKQGHVQRPLGGVELAEYEGPTQALGAGAEKEGAWRKRRMERWEGLQSAPLP